MGGFRCRRRLFLGDSLDTDRLEANYADGVLTVKLPVAERAKARRIPVSASAPSTTTIDAIDTHSKNQADDLVGASN